jgi:hypothetical protein
MSEQKYNGWTNYSTWRVNLEMFSDYDASWMLLTDEVKDGEAVATKHLARYIQDLAQENIIDASNPGPARDFALTFMWDVNWKEIAETIIDNMKQ